MVFSQRVGIVLRNGMIPSLETRYRAASSIQDIRRRRHTSTCVQCMYRWSVSSALSGLGKWQPETDVEIPDIRRRRYTSSYTSACVIICMCGCSASSASSALSSLGRWQPETDAETPDMRRRRHTSTSVSNVCGSTTPLFCFVVLHSFEPQEE